MDAELSQQKALSLPKTWENHPKILNYPINLINVILDVLLLTCSLLYKKALFLIVTALERTTIAPRNKLLDKNDLDL